MTVHAAREYQARGINQIHASWSAGARNVLYALPTGGGKTFVIASIVAATREAVCCIAHRSELVTQMSTALAREGVTHRVIGPDSIARACTQLHVAEFHRSYVDPNSRVAVASVDTLVRMPPTEPWFAQVGLWVQDECHHVLKDNKWGMAGRMFPNARGLGVTATPIRADGKGLGEHADGVMHAMVVGPTMRELIGQGYLTDYRIFAPPSDIDLASIPTTASGDYSPPKLRDARRSSHITGDVVQHYLRIARGKLGVTFDVDIDSATETAAAYNAAGVRAEVVTSKTPDFLRASILRRFRAREILQLVNVDLFGEGFDLPAIEVVSMARPTQSYSLYCQQFGRALRPLAGKDRAIIIDHVSNVKRHGLPDAYREWSLDRRERRSRNTADDTIQVRTCLNPECMSVFERALKKCPFCGWVVQVLGRSSPEQVEGDLTELDPVVLAALRGEIARIDAAPVIPRNAPPEAAPAIIRNHAERQNAQRSLRRAIALWGGWQKHQFQRDDSEAQRRFFLTFGVDVLTAQALGKGDAELLRARIETELNRHNVVEA